MRVFVAIECAVIKTPFTKMELIFENGYLISVDFFCTKNLSPPVSENAKRVCQQIDDYCCKQLLKFEFDVLLKPEGTAFQKRVWRALQKIPAGQVVTYGELAQRLKTSARAIGNACRANPVPLIVPCHRVVAKSGLGGFSGVEQGAPLKIKSALLEHEGVIL